MAGKALTEKLGVKPGYAVLLIGGGDWLLEEIGEAIGEEGVLFALDSPQVLERTRAIGEADAVLFWVGQVDDLQSILEMVRGRIKENGAIWSVITKKGYQEKEGLPRVKESDIRGAAKGAGLVDVKVARPSESLSLRD
ncbi:MAG: DUF3052 family protein, partial [Anaerolineae bacterium]